MHNRFFLSFSCWLITLFLCAPTAQATTNGYDTVSPVSEETEYCNGITYWVSPNGNNANDGLSPNSAVRTIQEAMNRTDVGGGDEVVIMDGTYDLGDNQETGVYDRVGTSSRKTTVRAQNRWGARIIGDAAFQIFVITRSKHVIIDGLWVGLRKNPADRIWPDCSGIRTEQGSNHITIRNCYVENMACNGIASVDGDYITIWGNVVRANAAGSELNCSGISIYQPLQIDEREERKILVARNVAYENTVNLDFQFPEAGIDIDQPTDGNGIIIDDFNNTQIIDDTQNPIYVGRVVVENNVCFNNGGAGVKVFETKNAVVRHNTCWHNLNVLKDFPAPFGEIDVSFTDGTELSVSNNIAVALPSGNVRALNYQQGANYQGNGYLSRYNNILVGEVTMPPNEDRWDAFGDDVQSGSNQNYVCFANATTNVGIPDGRNQFDPFFRLNNNSPGINSAFTGDTHVGVFNPNTSSIESATTGRDLENRQRPFEGGVDIGAYEGGTAAGSCNGSTSFPDDLISLSAPSTVSPGQTVTVTVNYSASTTRDVAVRLEDPQSGFAMRAPEARQTVGPGTGTLTFNITINSNIAIANNRYQWQSVVNNVGQWWPPLDNRNITGVSAVNNSGGGGGNGGQIGEVGQSTNNHTWTTVNLSRTYADPIVILGALPTFGGDPSTLRVRNVTSTSFQWRVDEWEYRDEFHANETVAYMVVESGRHTLPSGLVLEAGRRVVGTSEIFVSYSALPGAVGVFGTITTENEAEAVCVRFRNVTSSDFRVRIEEEENGGSTVGALPANIDRSHVLENLDYVVITTGSNDGSGTNKLEVGTTPASVTENDFLIGFQNDYGSNRRFFANAITRVGGDPGVIRYRQNVGYTGEQVNIYYQEEASRDGEFAHGNAEAVAYMMFDNSGPLNSSGSSLAAPTQVTNADGSLSEGTPELIPNTEVVSAFNEQSVTIYPNPNAGTFTLEVNSPLDLGRVRTELLDATGRRVHAEALQLAAGNNRVRVDARRLGLPAGVYTLRLLSAERGVLAARRVVFR